MKIDEAIKAQNDLRALCIKFNWKRYEKGCLLGIEALKKWKILREGRAGIIDSLLPGETEE